MKTKSSKSTIALAVTASFLGSAAWSTSSYACSSEPFISAVCIMAASRTGSFNGYMLATGTQLTINQYAALYSLIGITYGGDARTNFNLPNLQGRVVVGTGTLKINNTPIANYLPGQNGGSNTVTLSGSQLPAHVHTLTTYNAQTKPQGLVQVTATAGNMAVSMSGLTATTTMAGVTGSAALTGTSASVAIPSLSGTAKLDGVTTGSANGSGLTLNISTNGTSIPVPTSSGSAYLGQGFVSAKIYSTGGTPNVALASGASGSISGTAPVTFAANTTAPVTINATTVSAPLSGTAPVTFIGNPTTTVTGSGSLTGNPNVTIGGSTDIAGSSAPVAIMPPYLVMNYYINVTQGLYPQYD